MDAKSWHIFWQALIKMWVEEDAKQIEQPKVDDSKDSQHADDN